MSSLVPFTEMEGMAVAAAKSKLFGINTPEQAMALMLLCQAEGLHPGIALRDYHLIQGRPALKADAMLARFQQAGGSVKWKEYTDDKVTGEFSHPAGGTLEVTWTLEQAKRIGIANKDNWRNYPRAMLRARVLSEGIRAVYPGCVVGVYTPEEVQDFAPVKDMGPVERVEEPVEVAVPQTQNDGAFHLYLPGESMPYNSYHTADEWISGYCELVRRITASEKITSDQKSDKLTKLKETNTVVTEGFDSFTKIKLKGEMVKAGADVSPKPEQSLSSQNSKQSEDEFSNI